MAPYFLSSITSSAPTASILMVTGPFSTGEDAEHTLVDEETGALPAISRPSLFFFCAQRTCVCELVILNTLRIIGSYEHGDFEFHSCRSLFVYLPALLLCLLHVPHLQPSPVHQQEPRELSPSSLPQPPTTRGSNYSAPLLTSDLPSLSHSYGCTRQRSSWCRRRRWSCSGERNPSFATAPSPSTEIKPSSSHHNNLPRDVNVTLPISTLKNGSLYAHVFLTLSGRNPLLASDRPYMSVFVVSLTRYTVPKDTTFNLLSGGSVEVYRSTHHSAKIC